jgi:hypothetical protein
MKRIPLVGFLLLFATLALQADDAPDKLPLPAGILPARAPDQAAWKITVTYDAPAAANPAAGTATPPHSALLMESSITKSGRNYRRQDSFDDSTSITRWWIDGTVIADMGKGNYIISDYKDQGPFSYQNSDFPDLTWIGPDCYTRVEIVGGVTCFVFEKLRPRASDADIQQMQDVDRAAAMKDLVQTTVWINRETGLPVQESIPGKSESYTFLSPPPALMLPPEAAQKLALHEARDAQLTRRGPPP